MKEYRNLWNRAVRQMRNWGDHILRILYPPVCPFCGCLVKEGICNKCRELVVKAVEPRCRKCGKPVRTEEEEYCYDCRRGTHIFTEGRGLYVHKPPVSDAVYALKYHNRKIYAQTFARELAEEYGTFLRRKHIDLIIPIPLHKKRKRKRGFNQTELLAHWLGEYTSIAVDTRLLVRVKSTSPQKQLNEKQRKYNMKGAFKAGPCSEGIKNVVLIDDIYTTGSTMDEAARTLLRTGVENVYFLTISIGQGY